MPLFTSVLCALVFFWENIDKALANRLPSYCTT